MDYITMIGVYDVVVCAYEKGVTIYLTADAKEISCPSVDLRHPEASVASEPQVLSWQRVRGRPGSILLDRTGQGIVPGLLIAAVAFIS